MKKVTYDDSKEIRLNDLICILDENPKLVISPVESSTYLNFDFATSEEGFQQYIEVQYHEFMNYLNAFIKECLNTNETEILLLPTLGRLLTLYKSANYKFKHSNTRADWKHLAHYFSIFNPTEDFQIAKEEKYTRWAYSFFYKCSSIQLYFINKLIKDLNLLLKVHSIEAKNSENQTNGIFSKKSFKKSDSNYFIILEPALKVSHLILSDIYRELKDAEYIRCTLPQFKKVFESKEPMPIIWLKDYVHLSYIIKKMTGKFLKRRKSPSNYLIALKYFYNKEAGNFFTPKKVRHDKDPNDTDKIFIDKLLIDSISKNLKK